MAWGTKNGPDGPARTTRSGSRPSRYVPVVSILALYVAPRAARVSADGPETTDDYSKGQVPARGAGRAPASPRAVALGLAGVGLAGALCLVGATWATVVHVRVAGTAAGTAAGSGLDRHGPALVVVAGFAAVLLLPALRGTRAAMAAVAVAGLLALGIAVAEDVPALDDAGSVGVLGREATAEAGPGFFLETLGGTLLLLAGGGLLLTAAPDARTPPRGAASDPARGMRRADYRYQR